MASLGAFVSVVGGGELASLGGSELASLDGFVGVIWASDVASLGAGEIDELAPVWPQRGAFTGGPDGGGGGRA